MALPLELVSRLDFGAALETELTASNKLLPKRWDRRALRGSAQEIASNIRNRLTKGIEPRRANVIFVDKNRRGTRPISEMSLIDRTAYRAIVELIRASLPVNLSHRVTHQEFREAPLSAERGAFITATDVTSYYEFVDHDILAQELEAQSGEGLAIDALMTMLRHIMGKSVGLPQIHTSSDVLGDTYIDVVRRRLWREGYETFTFSDDFRIATASLADAKSALELCAREVRDLGLALNEAKTFTFARDTYEESLTAFADAERELFTADELDEFVTIRGSIYDLDDDDDDGDDDSDEPAYLRRSGPIGAPEDDDAAGPEPDDDDDEDQPTEAQQQAALRALETWTEQVHASDTEPRLVATAESLLGISLPVLGAAGSPVPLAQLSEILRFAPSLTPAVATYFKKLGRHGQSERQQIRRTLDDLTSEPSFSNWQRTWVAEAAGSIAPARNAYAHYDWLADCLESESPALAAVAASALGRLRKADTEGLKRLLNRIDPAWKQLVLWGLTRQDPAVAAASADDKIDRLLVTAVVDANG